MNDKDFNKKLLNLMESFPMIGSPMAQEEDSENVTYSKTKRQGDASVTISANAKSMQELHDVLRLAGITLPKNDDDTEPNGDEKVVVDPNDKDGDDRCDGCGKEIVDGECGCDDHDHNMDEPKSMPTILSLPSYSTDKSAIFNALKDKLQAKLS